MKAHIQIPRGWRRLRQCEKVRIFDKTLALFDNKLVWKTTGGSCHHVQVRYLRAVFIRKIARKGGKAK